MHLGKSKPSTLHPQICQSYSQSHHQRAWPDQIPRSTHLTHPISSRTPRQDTPRRPSIMVFRNRGAQFPPRDRARADLIKVTRLPPRPQSAGRPRASSLPLTARRRLPLRFLQLTWALGPRPHVTRFPDRRRLPLCPAASPHAAGRPGTPRPPARTAPEPGSAATSGTRDSQVGRVPPPGRGRPQAQTGSTRRPRRRPTPADPTTSAALTETPGLRFCGLEPTQAWLHLRAFTPHAASWELWRSRRDRTAMGRPSAARPPPPCPCPDRG